MKREFLAAAAAALTIGSSGAIAQDVTFTWDYVGYVEIFPGSTCQQIDSCGTFYETYSGQYSLTLQDNTTSKVTTGDGDPLEIISYKTSNGALVYYDEFWRTPGIAMDSVTQIDLTPSGGQAIYTFEAGPYQDKDVNKWYLYLPGTTPPSLPTDPPPVPEPSMALMLIAALSAMRLMPRRKSI